MNTLTGGRRGTNISFNGSFGPASSAYNDAENESTGTLNNEGEALLRIYKKKLMQDVFNKNIILSFESLFEAGYLYKYLSIVW